MKLLKFFTFVMLFGFTTIAQAVFPDKPIKIIVGFPPGGPLDTHAQLLIDQLQKRLGQPVVIDYKPGAGGSIGADFVIKSPADGYTLLMANTGTMVINPFVYTKNAYVTFRDFTPIARTAKQPLALVANNDVPVKTCAEFIDYAKKNTGKVNYGSAGNGSISHLVAAMLEQVTGIDMVRALKRHRARIYRLAGWSGAVHVRIDSAGDAIPEGRQGARAGDDRQGT